MLRVVNKYTPSILAIYDPETNQGIRLVHHAMSLSRAGVCNAGWVPYQQFNKGKNADYDILFVQQSVAESLVSFFETTTRIVIVDMDGSPLSPIVMPHVHGYTAEYAAQVLQATLLKKPVLGLDTFVDVPSWPVTIEGNPLQFGIPPGALHPSEYKEVAAIIAEIATVIPDVPFLLPVELAEVIPSTVSVEYYDPPTTTYARWEIYRNMSIGILPGSSFVQKTMLPVLECGMSRIPMAVPQLYSQLVSSPTLGAVVHTTTQWVTECQKLVQQEGLRTRRSGAFYDKIAARRSLLRGAFYTKDTFSALYKQIVGSFLNVEAA